MKHYKQFLAFMLALILCLAGITPLNVEAEEVTAETAYGDTVKYTVNYYLETSNGTFTLKQSVEKTAGDGMNITVAPDNDVLKNANVNLNFYKTPESQALDVVDGATVNFYYYQWIVATIRYFTDNTPYLQDNTSIKGITGQTFTAPLIDIDGYTKPEAQTITLNVSGNNVVDYNYTAIPEADYTVNYSGYDPVAKQKIAFVTMTKKVKVGESVTPAILSTDDLAKERKNQLEKAGTDTSKMTFDFSCYEAPTQTITKTVAADGSTVIEYVYNKVYSYYTVQHYFEQADGTYKLDTAKTVKAKAKTASKVTPAVGTYDNYTSPKTQTVNVSADDDTVVKYYYKLKNTSVSANGTTEKADEAEYTITDSAANTVSFKGTKKVGDVVIPSTVTINGKVYTVTAIADNAFLNVKDIKSVTIPATVKTIGKNAFKGCSNLEKVIISKNAVLKTIGNSAFEGCSKLKKITITAKVKKIGARAFYNCKSLKTVTFKGNTTTIGSKAFKGISDKTTVKTPKKYRAKLQKKMKKKSVGYVATWKFK